MTLHLVAMRSSQVVKQIKNCQPDHRRIMIITYINQEEDIYLS